MMTVGMIEMISCVNSMKALRRNSHKDTQKLFPQGDEYIVILYNRHV